MEQLELNVTGMHVCKLIIKCSYCGRMQGVCVQEYKTGTLTVSANPCENCKRIDSSANKPPKEDE